MADDQKAYYALLTMARAFGCSPLVYLVQELGWEPADAKAYLDCHRQNDTPNPAHRARIENAAMEQNEIFGEVIYSYSRAQAIEDGILVDLTDPSFTFRPGLNVLREAGIKYPVAMTSTAFARTVQEPDEPLPPAQDLSGRLWDVLTMFKHAARQGGIEVHFTVRVWNWVRANGERTERTKHEDVQLKAICGPGDTAEPVITIMLPDED